MGCCQSDPVCTLGKTEHDSINQVAKEAVQKSQLPHIVPYVAKACSAQGVPFASIANKIKSDSVPVRQYDPVPATAPRLDVGESCFKVIDSLTKETTTQASNLLMTAALNCTKGGNNEQQRKNVALRTIQRTVQMAVYKEVEALVNNIKAELMEVAPKAGSSPRAPPPSMGSTAPGTSSNSNGSRGNVPPANNSNSSGFGQQSQQQSPQQQQRPAGLDPTNLTATQKQQQYLDQYGSPSSPDHAPSEDDWNRYPVPEESGPWVRVSNEFYWSDTAKLFYFPAAGHFFSEEHGQWYDPVSDRWMTEDEHEVLLDRMAADGLY